MRIRLSYVATLGNAVRAVSRRITRVTLSARHSGVAQRSRAMRDRPEPRHLSSRRQIRRPRGSFLSWTVDWVPACDASGIVAFRDAGMTRRGRDSAEAWERTNTLSSRPEMCIAHRRAGTHRAA